MHCSDWKMIVCCSPHCSFSCPLASLPARVLDQRNCQPYARCPGLRFHEGPAMGGSSGQRGSVRRTTWACGQTVYQPSVALPGSPVLCGSCCSPSEFGMHPRPFLASPGFCAFHSSPSVIGSCISACIFEDCPFESLSARNPSRVPSSVPCQASWGARGERRL